MRLQQRALLNVFMVGLFAVGLSACFVAGPGYVVHDAAPKSGKTSQAAKKGSQAARKAAPDAKMSLRDQVHTRLHGECMSAHGGLLRADAKIDGQCGCYADTVAKSMQRDDQEFYMQYSVVPTLSVARPDDVKRKCGIAVVDRSGSRGPLPAPTY